MRTFFKIMVALLDIGLFYGVFFLVNVGLSLEVEHFYSFSGWWIFPTTVVAVLILIIVGVLITYLAFKEEK